MATSNIVIYSNPALLGAAVPSASVARVESEWKARTRVGGGGCEWRVHVRQSIKLMLGFVAELPLNIKLFKILQYSRGRFYTVFYLTS